MRLPTKLYVAIAAPCVVLALVGALFTRQGFSSGFDAYLAAQRAQAMELATTALAEAYAEVGAWEPLLAQRPRLRRMLQPILRAQVIDEPGEQGRPRGRGLGPWRRIDFSLVDGDGAWLLGRREMPANAQQQAIVVDGQVVGTLVVAFPADSLEPAERAFAQQQQQRVWWLLGGSLLVAAGIAWWLARGILRPVREVSRAAQAMARGAFDPAPALASDGEPARGDELAALARDIRKLAAALAAQQQARQQLMADVAHELRTPLAVMQSELEALEDGVRVWSPQALASLRGEVEDLARLVGDLRLMALADVGELPWAPQSVDVVAMVRHELARFGSQLAARSMVVAVHGPATLAWEVDPHQFPRVISNLLQNCVRYAKHGAQVWIEIGTDQGAGAALAHSSASAAGSASSSAVRRGEYLRISIEDDGPGVSDEQLPRLFERFGAVRSGAAAAGARAAANPMQTAGGYTEVAAGVGAGSGGTGLGLSLCKAIVERHGGKIIAERGPRGGLRLHFTLPRQESV